MLDTQGRHAAVADVARFFAFDHLVDDAPREIAELVADLAATMIDRLPDQPELTRGLHRLVEAKDCFVRAAVFGLPEPAF